MQKIINHLFKLTLLLGLMCPSAFGAGRSIEYSEAADVFEIVDQLSRWHPTQTNIIRAEWVKKFGELSSTDKSYLSDYKEMREKLQRKLKGEQLGDKLLGDVSPRYDYFSYSFYSSRSVGQALKKLSKKLKKDQIKTLSRFFTHFLPKISQFVSESTTFRIKVKELQKMMKKEKASRTLKDLEKFVGFRKAKVKEIKVLMVWWPSALPPRVEIEGKYILIRLNPLKEFDELKSSEIISAMVKSYLASLSPNFKNNLAKSFREKCPGREEEFKEAFVTVFNQIRPAKATLKKEFTLFKKWSPNAFVNSYSKLLASLIQENEKRREKLGGSFIHEAAKECLELHNLAVNSI